MASMNMIGYTRMQRTVLAFTTFSEYFCTMATHLR